MYLLVLAIMCLVITITDFRYRTIHNSILIVLLLVQCFLSPTDIHITTFLLVLSMGLLIYALIWIGAGDIKYAAILSLTIPLNLLPWAYVITGFVGGIIAVIYWLSQKLLSNSYHSQEGIPYGIAISVGFYLVIFTQSALHI
ncbi:prepilin peptidase [Vibrio sp. La 4.2.2]|uniref:A24 family peptidase n=1 Tax=Vibrio sp. La 4.2.2 TaxID=2998830 RepID=UPI0022CE100C|nr:prepilin peptidase [Vibrio sp. La 4.2.2]MDA0109939.1 prepilin peptidase [Vibrio sp. La 4.2.2]